MGPELDIGPAGQNLRKGFAALDLAARMVAGQAVASYAPCEAYHDENDEALAPIAWTYKETVHETVWILGLCVVGAASGYLSLHRVDTP